MRRKFEKALASELGLLFDDDDPVWCDAREVLITGGYRAGKTVRGAFKVLCRILDPRSRLIWLIGPEYFQAQEEFRYLVEWCLKLGLMGPNDYSMPADGIRSLTTVTGCVVQTRSAAHPERLASVAPDMILLCEPGQMSGEIYDTSLARLMEKRGDLWMVGTLEDSLTKPRWAWYEDLAVEWRDHTDADRQRSFTLPTYKNRALFPLGEDDPEIQQIKATIPDYKWKRMYLGIPQGVDNPVFESMWVDGAKNFYIRQLPEDIAFNGGANGVDYGRTWEHPSTVVVINQATDGTYWVRKAWSGTKVRKSTIIDVCRAAETEFDIWQGCVDPNQAGLAEDLNYHLALGGRSGGGQPTVNRFMMVNELLDNQALFFDIEGEGILDLWASMRAMGYVKDTKGRKRYDRPLGDDLGQALCYAVESLRGQPLEPLLPIDAGVATFRFDGDDYETESNGRA